MEEQLAERDAQKRMEKALRLQEEQGSLLDMAAELKSSMEVLIDQFSQNDLRSGM